MAESGQQQTRRNGAQGYVPPDENVTYSAIEKMMNGGAGAINGVGGKSLDSPEVHAQVKKIAVESDLRVNKLSEIAGYLRWAALGAATPAVGMLVAAVTTTAATFSLPIFAGFMVLAVGLGAVQMAVSQRARELQSSRFLDVGLYMNMRNATETGKLVGKEVTRAIEGEQTAPAGRKDGKSWGSVIQEQQASKAALRGV
jgi:hypothetical protein